jgi:hypothetical protein
MMDSALERFLNEPVYAWKFQFMIGDLQDFLDFSERNIEWQYRRELRSIHRRAQAGEFRTEEWYREQLETNAEHRFKVSLPLRVRYAVLIGLTTSLEWSIHLLVKSLRVPLSQTPRGHNKTVHALIELQTRTGVESADLVLDYKALVIVRNCIAHSAGIEEHYKYRDLAAAVNRLIGITLDKWHFLGRHVCIERGALNPYVQRMGELIVALHRAADEQDLLKDDP